MRFGSPWWLALGVVVVAALAAGAVVASRRRSAALAAAGLAGAGRRRLTAGLWLSIGGLALALAVAGPAAAVPVAEKAAADFIRAQPGGARIGLVAFAGIAAVTVPPTTDTKALLDALPELTTSRGTAIGQAILTSIDAIADIDPSVPPTGAPATADAGAAYAADVIVVLTDGANTQGVEPKTAAQEAAARKLRVYPIGFGTTTPAPIVCDASQLGDSAGGPFGGGGGGGPFGGGGGRGGGGALVADYGSLQQVAAATGGQFYAAKDAGQLQSALSDLPRAITVTHKDRDLAAFFAGIGGLLVAAAVGLSLWWNRVRSVTEACGFLSGVRHVPDEQRRARPAVRHALAAPVSIRRRP